MLNYKQIEVSVKSKKQFMKVLFSKVETNKDQQLFNAEWSKKSDQPLNVELSNAIDRLIPHLMFGSTMANSSIDLDENMDYEKWFKEHHYNDDERFDGVVVTKVQFFGNDNLESVKLFGYKLAEEFGKPYKVKFDTPVIALDRHAENKYPLVVQLEETANDIQVLTKGWLEKGETLNKAQVAAKQEQEAAEVE